MKSTCASAMLHRIQRSLRHLIPFWALCVVADDANAFDGQRKGFVLGFGAGVTHLFWVDTRANTTGTGLDLKVGYAPTNQLQLHYSGKTYILLEDSIAYGMFAPQLGAQYYLHPSSRSWFFGAGLGVFAGGNYSEDEFDGRGAGFSAYAGVGYEFSSHFYVELDMVPAFKTANGGSFAAAFLTVHAIAY